MARPWWWFRHTGKKGAREFTSVHQADSYAGRGGASLSDAARSVLFVAWNPEKNGRRSVSIRLLKSTHGPAGHFMTWFPQVAEHLGAVYLVPATPDSTAFDETALILEHVRSFGSTGVTKTSLRKSRPPGVGPAAAKRIVEALLGDGSVITRQEVRGRNRQLAEVFYAASAIRSAP